MMDRTEIMILALLVTGVALIYAGGGAITLIDVGGSLFLGAIFLLCWHLLGEMLPKTKKKRRSK